LKAAEEYMAAFPSHYGSRSTNS